MKRIKSDEIPFGMRSLLKNVCSTKALTGNRDPWWNSEEFGREETIWKDDGDGATYTTMHQRDVRLTGDNSINPPGVYTQTAIVTRTDGDGEAIRVIVSYGKRVEIYDDQLIQQGDDEEE